MERRLREREQWLTTTLTSIGDAIIAIDLERRITFMNPPAEAVTGWRREDAYGRPITEVCTLRDERGRSLNNPVVQALQRGAVVGQASQSFLGGRGGRMTPVSSTAAPIHDQQRQVTGAVVVFQDMTSRKSIEDALQVEMQIAAALAEVGKELIAALGSAALTDRLCELTAKTLGCEFSYTWLWQPEKAAYVPVASWGDSAEQWEASRALLLPRARMRDSGLGPLEEGELVEIEASTHPALEMLAGRSGVTSLVGIALKRGADLLGIQTAGYRHGQQRFTSTQERLARGIGQLASLALDSACLMQEAELTSELKSNFLASISHELRTPLTIIMGYTDMLLEGGFGPLAPEQSHCLRKVDQSARELLELIVAMLNVSRLEIGQFPVEITRVDTANFLSELRAELMARGAKPGVNLVWSLAPDLPDLWTDQAKLKIILKNLVGNAIKFTDAGEVRVVAARARAGIEFTVSDTGIGIVPEALPIIFEPFRQDEKGVTWRHGGIGLGLYTVRRFVEALSGEVAVASELGKGSTFRVWLPHNDTT
jgi:PAS domain S-box-containing protein